MEKYQYTNELVDETSPYLLQHAHNPVNWMPWGEKAFEKARTEQKPVIISIGYAACHWCHVMEHESFEDRQVAQIMNENFVCIKVDREERPDVDHIYMTAVQLMTQRGGWPLNAVALPDGRPFWGGTYFQKPVWIDILTQLSEYYRQHPAKVDEYATLLNNGIHETNLIPVSQPETDIDPKILQEAVQKWKTNLDFSDGGSKGAPKFMMPNNLLFLLRWAHQNNAADIQEYVETTLDKMAFSGIYDQLGGGFARYSTDEIWKVPHFEKMLYDNGQLLSLYALAYQKTGKILYREIAGQTIGWLKREMFSPENGFYSSLDADSEGEEGKYYIWRKPELQAALTTEFQLFADYFEINENGYWEDGNYILLRRQTDESFVRKLDMDMEELKVRVANWRQILFSVREQRVRPRLDDKILTSWNALAIIGLADAFRAFENRDYLDMAEQNFRFIRKKMVTPDGLLWHSYKNGQSKINGFLEDYALLIQASLSLFEITGEAEYLHFAESLTQKTIGHFFNPEKTIFYFTSASQTDLINRSIEVYDQVIPASNSVMAGNLFRLGHILVKPEYIELAKKMLARLAGDFRIHPSGYSNWMQLLLNLTEPVFEVVVAGPAAFEKLRKIQKNYLPNCIFCASDKPSDLELLAIRFIKNKTLIYICRDNTCNLPVESPEQALAQLH